MDIVDKIMLIIILLLIIGFVGGCISSIINSAKADCLTLSAAYPNLTFEYRAMSCNLVIDGIYKPITTHDVLILQKLNDK